MCMYIGIEDLAANALICILSQGDSLTKENRFIRFSLLLAYGIEAVKVLNSKNEETVLIYSRESNSAFFRDYSDFFERKVDEEGYVGIQLKDGISVKDICIRFIGQIPSVVQDVLSDDEILDKFFKAA